MATRRWQAGAVADIGFLPHKNDETSIDIAECLMVTSKTDVSLVVHFWERRSMRIYRVCATSLFPLALYRQETIGRMYGIFTGSTGAAGGVRNAA
jgi:hypothetical protein